MTSLLTAGDRVELTAPDKLLEDGYTVFKGERGVVVGFKGLDQVVVSWGMTPPYRTGTCKLTDVTVVYRGAAH